MKQFLDQDFLLSNETAVKLFHDYADKLPIIDYHCHINPSDIALDHKFDNITQVWLGGDHYKWRLMRSYGIDEYYITGDAPDKEKFIKWADTLSKCIGNPLYHWSHLELQRYFDYNGVLNQKTAEEVWELCNAKLAEPSMSVRNIIRKSNVTHICTTDDPVDDLKWHDVIAADTTFEIKVIPAWRPDKAMNLEKDDYLDYLEKLEQAAGIEINSYEALQSALRSRIEYFHQKKCRVSDHGLDFVMYAPASEAVVKEIFKKRLEGTPLTETEVIQFKTDFMLNMGKLYQELGWVMQLHYGCKRSNNTKAFSSLGADTGYDCISNFTPSAQIADFLNALDSIDRLPKTIIYSLNPADNAIIDSIIGCFQNSSAISKIQHGSAWWFNDHKTGMTEHLTSLANLGFLSGFVGMLTDSRSFLSYPRHEYFRRILCNLIGTWVEDGEYPPDYEILGEIVSNICYHNALNYFDFN
jgi:glucuronate isomerase